MYSNLFVVLFGMGTVFTGLVCIIILTSVISRIVQLTEMKPAEQTASGPEAPAKAAAASSEEKAAEQQADHKPLAALIAAISMEEHVAFEDIQIVSIKQVS